MRTQTYKEAYAGLVSLLPYRDYWSFYGFLLTCLAVVPFFAPTYVVTYMTLLFVAAIGAVGLNLVTGTAGLISLGHAGFLAIGAYAAGILITDYSWGIVPAIVAAGFVAAASSLLVGVPSLRLKGLYLAITTLAFSIIVTQMIVEMDSLTGGSSGKTVGRPDILGLIPMKSSMSIYFLSLAFVVLTVIAALNLLRSRVGRAWGAIRDYDIAASLMGVDVVRYKLMAFATSAFFTGVAGALLGLHLRYLNVDNFALVASIEALAMIIVGGLGSVRGAILGAVLITILPDISRLILNVLGGPFGAISQSNAAEVRGVIYALVIMAFLRFEPDGLAARWARIKRFWLDWPFGRGNG
jgi:branched-chain amino acid transport system permease protein